MMIFLFSSSVAMLIGCEAIALIFTMTRLYDGAALPAVLALLAAGTAVSLLVAGVHAALTHHKLLLVLYALAKPEAFVQAYAPLLDRRGVPRNVRFTMRAYLSNGLAAMGDLNGAREQLDRAPVLHGRRRAEGERMLAGNRASIALAAGDVREAGAQCDRLEALIASGHLRGGRLDAQQRMLRTLRAQTAVLSGQFAAADSELLRDEYEKTRSALRRTELGYYLGLAYAVRGKRAEAQARLSEAAKTQGDTHYGRLAARRLSALRDGKGGEQP